MLAFLLAIGGVGLVGLALVGGLYATVSHATKKAPTPTTVDLGVPGAAAGVAPAVRPLSDVLVNTTPADYTPVDPGAGPSGPFDLKGFVQFAENPKADRVAFERNGFVGGFVRTWRRAGPLGESRLVASVFEFSTADGAKAVEEYESARTVREDKSWEAKLYYAKRLADEYGMDKIHGTHETRERAGDEGLRLALEVAGMRRE